MRQRILFVFCFLALVGGGRWAHGQSPQAIPAPLVAALLGGGGGREFSVGTLPRGYPSTLVPAGPVTIVGGMISGNEIIALFVDSTRRLADTFEELFERTGFVRPPDQPGSGFAAAFAYSSFCNDSVQVTATPMAGPQRHHVRVRYYRAGPGHGCPMSRREPERGELVLPELIPPPGVSIGGSGGGSGGDGVNSRAEVWKATIAPSAIVAHYTKQLLAAGWTAGAVAIDARVAAQFLEAKDSTGGAWEGVLMATGSETGMRLSLVMHPRHKP